MGTFELQAPPATAGRCLQRAWRWLGGVPLALVAGLVGGELAVWALGYDIAVPEAVPLPTTLLIWIPATAVMMAPGLLAYSWGRRARDAGERWAMVPALLGGALSALIFVEALGALMVVW